MAWNYNESSVVGSQYCYWGIVGTNGYVYGTSGSSMANGSDSAMGRLKGLQSLTLTVPEAPRVNIPGDNGAVTQMTLQPQELPSGTATFGVFNQTFNTKVGGMLIDQLGDFDISGGVPQCWSYARIALVVNSPAIMLDAGANESQGWQVTIINNLTVVPSDGINISTATAQAFPYSIQARRATQRLWGTAYTTVTNGSTAFTHETFTSPYPVTIHTFIGDGSDTTLTLAETPAEASGDKVKVTINGVIKTYSSDYTVNTSTKVLTFATAPASGAICEVVYQHLATC